MRSLWPYLRRAPRTLMFWMVVAVFAVALLRSFFPDEGFDEVRTGEQPLEVAGADDGLWVLNHVDHSVSLVDVETREEQLEVALGDDAAPALTANDDGAYVILDSGRTVARVDPADGEIADRYDVSEQLPDEAQDLAAGDGFVWVTSETEETGAMVKVDTETGEVGEPIELDEAVVQPQVLGDRVWVNQSSGLYEYDVETGEEVDAVRTQHRVHDFFAEEDVMWLVADVDTFDQTGLVVRIDLRDDDVPEAQRRIAESSPARITVADGRIFVSGTGGLLFELSQDPLEIEATEQVAASTKDLRGVVVVDDTVWVADGTNGVAYQPVDGLEGGTSDSPVP